MNEFNSRNITIRVVLGELMLLGALAWSNFLWLPFTNAYVDPIKNPISYTALTRNSLIFLSLFVIGSLLAYGKLIPFGDRSFGEYIPDTIQEKYTAPIWAQSLSVISILLLVFGFFTVFASLFSYDYYGLYESFTEFMIFSMPTLVFGYKWYNSANYLTRVSHIAAGMEKPLHTRLLDDTDLSEIQQRNEAFHVVHPSIFKWVVIAIITIILDIGLYAFLSIPLLIALVFIIPMILTVYAWKTLSKRVARYLLLKPIIKWNNSRDKKHKSLFNRFMSFFLNIDYSEDTSYFVEQYPRSLDLNEIGALIKSRAFIVITSVIPTSYLMLFIFYPPWTLGRFTDSSILELRLLFIILASPILLFWFVPVIWITKDIGLKSINDVRSIKSVSDHIEKSQLQGFLGVAGILGGIGYNLQIYAVLPNFGLFGNPSDSSVSLYLLAFVYVIFLMAMVAGTIYFSTIVYFSYFHENIVNELRQELFSQLPVATPLAKRLDKSKIEIFEKIQ